MDVRLTSTNGRLDGFASANVGSAATDASRKGAYLEIVGEVQEDGRMIDVTAKFYWRGTNFSSIVFNGTMRKGTWRDNTGLCDGVYEFQKVE